MYQSAEELIRELDSRGEMDLAESVAGRSFTYGVMLNGVVEHTVYHGGQIAMLSKLM